MVFFSDNCTEYGDFFQCDNDFCVRSSVTCNGYNDCLDNSDETKCGMFLGKKPQKTLCMEIGVRHNEKRSSKASYNHYYTYPNDNKLF